MTFEVDILETLHGVSGLRMKLAHPRIEEMIDWSLQQPAKKAEAEAFLELVDSIAESQYKLAKHLARNGDKIAVIRENNNGVTSTHPLDREESRRVFPKGLPKSFSKLSFLQKKYLVNSGGVEYALASGIIHETYDDDLTYTNNKKRILGAAADLPFLEQPPALLGPVWQKREYLALAQAQRVAEKTHKKITYVVGAAHSSSIKNVARCFPEIQLSFVNLTAPVTLEPEAEAHNRAIASSYPEVNCSALAMGFFGKPQPLQPPLQLSNNNRSENSNLNHSALGIGSIIALGVVVFGIFRCCRKKPKATYDMQNEKVNIPKKSK